MKRLWIVLAFALIMVITAISGENVEKQDIIHEIYIPSNSYLAQSDSIKIIKTGAFDIVRVDNANYDDIKRKIRSSFGESVRYLSSKEEALKFVKSHNIRIVDKVVEDDKILIYGYTPKLEKYVVHKGQIVNIQIVYGNNMIKIGTPLIMGSY